MLWAGFSKYFLHLLLERWAESVLNSNIRGDEGIKFYIAIKKHVVEV